jgi:hypothetical protein
LLERGTIRLDLYLEEYVPPDLMIRLFSIYILILSGPFFCPVSATAPNSLLFGSVHTLQRARGEGGGEVCSIGNNILPLKKKMRKQFDILV